MSSEYLIPHPNVPTSDIGLPKLKESVMLFNENFNALDSQARSNSSNITSLADSKAEKDHTHDTDYAKLGHTHSIQEVSSLEENLELKAPLVHVHDQYLTTLPDHTHDQSEITNLTSDLAGKASASHVHNLSDVNNLISELSGKASNAQLAAVESEIPNISGLTKDKFVSVGENSQGVKILTTPEDQPVSVDSSLYPIYPVGCTSENCSKVIGYTRAYLPYCGEKGGIVIAVGQAESITTGNLLMGGDGVDIADSGIDADDILVDDEDDPYQKKSDVDDEVTSKITDLNLPETYSAINHNHDGSYAPSSTISFPGFGGSGTASTASHSDHTHTVESLGLGDAAKKNVDVSEGVMSFRSKLDTLDGTLNENGTMPVSNIYDSNCTSSCLAISTGGVFGHSGSKLENQSYFGGDWPTLKAISQCFIVVGDTLNVLISKISGRSTDTNKVVTTNDSGNLSLNSPGNGLQVSSGSLSVKCKQSGGIESSSDGIYLGGLTGNKWVKTNADGKIITSDDDPIIASKSSTGLVYNATGTVSYKTIGGANGIAGLDNSSKIPIGNIPTGTSNTSVSLGDHNHNTLYAAITHGHYGMLTTSNYSGTLDNVYAPKIHTHQHDDISDWDSATSEFLTDTDLTDYAKKNDIKPGSDGFYPSTSDFYHKHSYIDIAITSDHSISLSSIFNTSQKVKGSSIALKSNGGLTSDNDQLCLGGMTKNKWVKTNNSGVVSTTDDNPTLRSGDFTLGYPCVCNSTTSTEAGSIKCIKPISTGTVLYNVIEWDGWDGYENELAVKVFTYKFTSGVLVDKIFKEAHVIMCQR